MGLYVPLSHIWGEYSQKVTAFLEIVLRVTTANRIGIVSPLRHVPGLQDHCPLFRDKPGRIPAVAPINSVANAWLFRFVLYMTR
jgi:hypothetical protein